MPTIDGYTGWAKDWEQPWDFYYENETDRELMPDEITAQWVAEKLEETHDDPFIVGSMNRPHAPRYVPTSFFDKFPLETIEVPPYLENDLIDTPSILWENDNRSSALIRFLRVEIKLLQEVKCEVKKWVQSYLACVSFVDHQVGVILDQLENSTYANTIVIFTADLAIMGRKNHMAKTTIWEESTRVPFVVYAPGVSIPGGKVSHPVSLLIFIPL